jgi:hypothetical protein
MGIGPSASGKTYFAKTIITMLSNTDLYFPKSFLSIDGGIYREKCYILLFSEKWLKFHKKCLKYL